MIIHKRIRDYSNLRLNPLWRKYTIKRLGEIIRVYTIKDARVDQSNNEYMLAEARGKLASFVLAGAKRYAYELAKQEIGIEYSIEAEGAKGAVWICHVRYADDDPVWNMTPTLPQCQSLYSAVCLVALLDGGFKVRSENCQWDAKIPTDADRRFVLKSWRFRELCDWAGLDGQAVQERLNRGEAV